MPAQPLHQHAVSLPDATGATPDAMIAQQRYELTVRADAALIEFLRSEGAPESALPAIGAAYRVYSSAPTALLARDEYADCTILSVRCHSETAVRQDDALNAAMRASRDRRVLAMTGGNPEALEEIRRFDVRAVGRRIGRLLGDQARMPTAAESQAFRTATTTALPVSHEAPSETQPHDPDTCWCNDDAFGLGPCRECRAVFQRTRARLADAVEDGQ